MPDLNNKITLVKEWIKKADDDLAVAEILTEGTEKHYTNASFHSQQAAEKYLKAFLTFHEIEFPKTHSIIFLLELVKKSNSILAASLQDISILNEYSVSVRYPGELSEATELEAVTSVRLARQAMEAVKKDILLNE